MKVMVTGSTGFVGRALVDYLLANGVNFLVGVCKESRNLPDSVQQLVIGGLSLLEETSFALKHTIWIEIVAFPPLIRSLFPRKIEHFIYKAFKRFDPRQREIFL